MADSLSAAQMQELQELEELDLLQKQYGSQVSGDASGSAGIAPEKGALRQGLDSLVDLGVRGPSSFLGIPVDEQTLANSKDMAAKEYSTGLEIAGAGLMPPGAKAAPNLATIQKVGKFAAESARPAVGAFFARLGNQAGGLTEPQTLGENMSQLGGDLAISGGTGATLEALSAIAGRVRSILPSRATIEYKESQKLGSTAAALNAPRGTTNRESQLVEDIIPKEETLIRLDPSAGIDPADPKAFQKFQANIDATKKGAIATKKGLLDSVDSEAKKVYDAAEKAGVRPIRGVTFKMEDFLSGKEELTDGAEREIRDLYKQLFQKKVDSGIVSGSEAIMRDAAREMSAKDLQFLIRRKFDNELRKLGAFDDLMMSKIATDPAAYAKVKDKIDAYKRMRTVTQTGLMDYSKRILGPEKAKQIDDANESISAMIEYENLANRFSIEGLQGQTPGSGRAMTTPDPSAMRNKFGLLDVATGGMAADAADLQRRQANLERGGEAVQSIQNIVGYRNGTLQPPNSLREALPGALDAAGQVAPKLSVMLPDVAAFFKDPMLPQTMAQMGLSPELQQEAQAVQNLGREEKEQTMGKILQETRGTGLFPASPVDGISSFIPSNSADFAGKITDRVEREKVRNIIRQHETDSLKMTRLVSALNKDAKLLEIPPYLRADFEEPISDGIEVPKASLKSSSSTKTKTVETSEGKRVDHDF